MRTYLPHRRKSFRTAGGGGFPTTSLVSFWPMDEGGTGNAIDSYASNDLTSNNSVGFKTSDGPDSNANVRAFTAASSMSFTRADDGTFDAGTGDFSWSMWVRLPTGVANNSQHPVFTKKQNGNPSNAGYEFVLTAKVSLDEYNVTTNASSISDGTTEVAFSTATISGTAINQWVHLIFVVDRTADTMALYVDDTLHESVDISSVTGSLDNSEQLEIGERISDYSGIDAAMCGFWSKALDASERTALYNGGSFFEP